MLVTWILLQKEKELYRRKLLLPRGCFSL
ncbi:hypothetical protein GBAR_LOCUS17448 [Geodia barretti]|uniref:Uncharacterized protein n=1 Tax=Geodia barretti TaxID=519541 RepID=A0AA35SLE6_GEOBA|nr:hypothetical protein GBAR_LOCUS17448 [Geodia barretti]